MQLLVDVFFKKPNYIDTLLYEKQQQKASCGFCDVCSTLFDSCQVHRFVQKLSTTFEMLMKNNGMVLHFGSSAAQF